MYVIYELTKVGKDPFGSRNFVNIYLLPNL